MARTYKRDARGRFASGGGSSEGGSKGKTLKRGRAQLSEARGKVRTAKGKLAAFDPADQTIKSSLSKRAQRGAVTKAEKRLTTVKRTAVIKGRRMTGTIGKPKAGRGRSAPKTRVVTGARAVSGGKNRLTRDNAGRITSVGGQGATARGGRLRTASGAKRGAVIVRMNSTGGKLRKPIGGGARISRAEPLATGGTLAARSSLTRARRKLEQNATPAQRGAVTRAKKYAAQSYDKNTQPRKFGRPASVMRKRPPERPAWWGVKGAGMVGKAKGARSAAPKKTSAKYKLTPSRLNEKLAEYDHSRAMRAIASNTSPFPEGGKRRKQTIKTARSAERFRQSLQAEATRLYREVGKDWAKARVAAFSMRPRYSTKQGVRRVWGPRTNPSVTKIKGW